MEFPLTSNFHFKFPYKIYTQLTIQEQNFSATFETNKYCLWLQSNTIQQMEGKKQIPLWVVKMQEYCMFKSVLIHKFQSCVQLWIMEHLGHRVVSCICTTISVDSKVISPHCMASNTILLL